MSKNHPNDNIYSILGKLDALKPTPQEKHDATVKQIQESVEAQGSILRGLREVSSTEQRLAKQFAESKTDEGVIGNIKNTVRAANYDRLAKRSANAGGWDPGYSRSEWDRDQAKSAQRSQKAKDISRAVDHTKAVDASTSTMGPQGIDYDNIKANYKECAGCAMGECSVHGGMTENDDDNDLKILDACAAIYRTQYDGGDEIWDADWMQDWAHALRQANPTDKELDFIIAKGQMPKRLANVELDVGDDFQFSEGEITRKPGVTTHTKTDYPGYPTDDLEKDDDDRTGPKSIGGRGRPRKAQTKNPRRDPNALKKGRGRPASVKSSPVSMPTDPFGRVTGRVPAGKKGTVHSKMDESIKRLVTESVNFKRMMEEQHMTLDEMLECMNQDMKQFKESGVCSDRLRDMLEVFAHAKKQMEETIDPTNPRDYEIPTVQRQAQGQAPLTMKDVQDKEQKAAIDYQRRVGNVQQDPMEEELNELARLAGLGEVSRGEYIKQQDTAAEKSGKNEFNAFGQLFNTDEVNEDDIEEGPEIFKLKADAAKKAGEKEFKGPDGKMYPVQEDKVEVDNTDESEEDHANKPNPKYGTVKNIIDQGDDLNRKKKQDPHTANRAANPLTNSPTLEAKLMAEYESIKKSK